jgi:hypothetical protein
MARKKNKTHPQRTPLQFGSRAYNEKAYAAIRKIFRVYGLDPCLLDEFSKTQRNYLLSVASEPTRFKVEEGHRVPKQLVNFVAESTHRFMRTHYFGDESIGLTYLELLNYGMAFTYTVIAEHESRTFAPKQLKIIDELAEVFDEDRVRNDLVDMGTHIRKMVMMISKMNFRIYGFDWKIRLHHGERFTIKSEVYLSSDNPKSIYFTYKQRSRQAFNVRFGRIISTDAGGARIDQWFVTDEDSQPPIFFDIYIQSHALQRVKERIDIFPAHIRNFYVMEPLMYMHRVVRTTSGSNMLECYTMDGYSVIRFGYYPFIIRQNKLIVLTFLPLVSPETEEGVHLYKTLGLQMEDTIFLGMDKLSFFCTVDFEQIPVLKQALANSSIGALIKYAAKHPDVNSAIDEKKTLMVKKFFDKKTEFNQLQEKLKSKKWRV